MRQGASEFLEFHLCEISPVTQVSRRGQIWTMDWSPLWQAWLRSHKDIDRDRRYQSSHVRSSRSRSRHSRSRRQHQGLVPQPQPQRHDYRSTQVEARASPAFASSASTPGASSSWQGPVVAASASSRGPDVADLVRLASSSYAPTLDPTGLATTHPIRFIESDWNQGQIDALSERMMADEDYRDSFWAHWAHAGMYGDSTDDDEPYRDELGDHLGHSSSAVDAFALTPSQGSGTSLTRTETDGVSAFASSQGTQTVTETDDRDPGPHGVLPSPTYESSLALRDYSDANKSVRRTQFLHATRERQQRWRLAAFRRMQAWPRGRCVAADDITHEWF